MHGKGLFFQHMAHSFLDDVVQILKEEYGDRISDLTFLVPNKRAVVFLKQAIGRAYQKTIWSPNIQAVQQFLRQQAQTQFPDPLSLTLELYETYQEEARKLDPDWNESLESFFGWGEMILKDFDEVDKYLIPAEKLFSNISDLREIDAFFALSEEEKEALQQLWQALRGSKASRKELEARYLTLWNLLYPVYKAFRERLASKGLAYDGMAYRDLADRFSDSETSPLTGTFIFVGFNALLKSEEVIIHRLLSTRQATVFWDVHPWYYPRTNQHAVLGREPGKFIRGYHEAWTDQGLDSRLIYPPEREQTIHLVAAPQNIGQARYLGKALKELSESHQIKEWATQAVVLAEEQLLFPVLEGLPPPAQFPNVTMGYPLRQAHIYHLVDSIIEMLGNRVYDQERGWMIGYKDIQRLLLHPYLQALYPEGEQVLTEMAKANLVVSPAKGLRTGSSPKLLDRIFDPPAQTRGMESVKAIFDYLDDVMKLILASHTSTRDLEVEFLFRLRESLTLMYNTLSGYHQQIRIDALGRLLKQALKGIRIPFEGEPLKGLQVMGFLETRGLDFERIFILSANEGTLPDTSTGNSFVPYLLRKAFGMPTFEEKDAIYSYHFYRFLGRPSEIFLVYNRVMSDGPGGGEISRFLQQIRFFFPALKRVTIKEYQAIAPAQLQTPRKIHIENSAEIRQRLFQRFGQKHHLSASSLNSYRTCSLQFYFRYLAGLSKQEEVDLTMPANTFGILLHSVLEQVYEHLPSGVSLSAQEILDQKTHLKTYLQNSLKNEKLDQQYLLQGENILRAEAILKQSALVLDYDASQTPFILIKTEEELTYPGSFGQPESPLRLSGKLDRTDEADGGIRVLDYKTGSVNLKKATFTETTFEEGTDKIVFQGMIYALLQHRKQPDTPTKVGFYDLKKPSKGIQYMYGGSPVPVEDIEAFEEGLQEFVVRMMKEPFVQTENPDTCKYCDFKRICQRD